ncbi:MAG: response regulator transcription factor [Bacteroidota bacterium]
MNIALIDDHLLLSEAVANALRQHMGNPEVRTFTNGTQFLSSNFASWQPHLVILDMLMPGPNGIEVMEIALKLLDKNCKFILLSSISDVFTIKNAIRKGASGYLSKDTPLDELLSAIAAVSQGEQYIGKNLRDGMIKYMFAEDQILFHLSPREKLVLEKICMGKIPKEIAIDTGLSLHTIQEYLRSVMKKFKVNRTTDLVVFAIQKGLHNPNVRQ